MHSSEVVVIGGGVIGCAVAYYTAKKGLAVTVVEREDLCTGSSGACDTAIHLQAKNPGLHLKMALESKGYFPELQKDFDVDIHFRTTGVMIAIQTEEQLEVMKEFVVRQRQTGLDVTLLEVEKARERQPALSKNIVGSTYSAMDGIIHPQFLSVGYYRAAKKYGAKTMLHTEVLGIRTEKNRVNSVITSKGEIKCKYVVNACGAYAPFIGKMVGLDIPIVPRRGQIIVTEPVPQLIRTIINCARYVAVKFRPNLLQRGVEADLGVGLSLTQTERGNLLIGGTREFAGYDKRTTHKALNLILKHAASIVPQIKDINIIRTFAGLRPYTPDGLPVLGKVPGIEGFLLAAGHEGDGLALSPITGRIISEIIGNEKTVLDIDLSKLSLERFKNIAVPSFNKQS